MKEIKQLIQLKQLFSVIFAVFLVTGCGENVTDNGMGEFLPVEEAFVLKMKANSNSTITAHWDIAEGYHLYKDKFEFSLGNNDYQIKSLDMPKGETIDDKVFGKQEAYHGALDINIALKALKENGAGEVLITTKYQGCSGKGLCYPPQSVDFTLKL